MDKKTKGTIAELAVAKHLLECGYGVLFPANENCRYDLVAEMDGRFWRIQVKFSTPKNGVLRVNCCSSNNWSVKPYTTSEIDFIAVFDPASSMVYFVPANEINDTQVSLRINDAKNHQENKIKFACEYLLTPY